MDALLLMQIHSFWNIRWNVFFLLSCHRRMVVCYLGIVISTMSNFIFRNKQAQSIKMKFEYYNDMR